MQNERSNNLVNNVQERALRLTYKDNVKQFPNITKWKQWNIYTPKKPAISNDGDL